MTVTIRTILFALGAVAITPFAVYLLSSPGQAETLYAFLFAAETAKVTPAVQRATTTATTHYYTSWDCNRYQHWQGRTGGTCNSMPRVLLFTWCTESAYTNYRNEVYWKACYAHMHGFDLVIADPFNTKETKDWYTNFNLWAWWVALVDYVPKYDYVFTTGADVLISEHWLHFPVWAFDSGNHDLSIMDQCYSDWGFNENAFLFKNTSWSMEFLTQGLKFKKKEIIQGDNGGWMESILIAVGQEAEARGEKGYDNECLPHLELPEPMEVVLKRNDSLYTQKNKAYSRCFFKNLYRMAGPYNKRRLLKHIGFNPLKDVSNRILYSSVPWANCWSLMHDQQNTNYCLGPLNPATSCFAFHWNGLSKLLENHKEVKGTCPDPTFRWDLSPYNTINRKS